ncbi:hypothetical protein Sjap_019882 [Stephania japonica]|uniref:Uncharacterized protein n=1 Tax=Stephania japonica TaxID=461633 RepID=A0AAP0HV53_9MAGN
MKGSSKLVMVATLVTALSLTMVLLLILVLLAQLYCSLLRNRNRRLTNTTPAAAASTTTATAFSPQLLSSPLSSVYAQGVLRAPRSFLFPAIIGKEEQERRQQEQERKHGLPKHHKLHQCQVSIQEQSPSSHHIGNIISASTSPSPSFISVVPKPPFIPQSKRLDWKLVVAAPMALSISFTYRIPFTTMRLVEGLETGGCSSSNDDDEVDSEEVGLKKVDQPSSSCSSSSPAPPLLATTPPLTPMKKLSIGPNSTSTGTCSLISQCCSSGMSSSSSCASPCTSPSW